MALVNEVTSRINQGEQIGIVGNACWVYLKSDTTAASNLAYLPAGIEDYTPWFDAMFEDYYVSGVELVLISDQNEALFCDESFLTDYRYASEAYGYKVYERMGA